MAAAAPAGADPAAPVVVVRGLNNPRQIVLLANKELLIAEAGKGGTTQVGTGDEAQFVGLTGSVSSVTDPQTVTGSNPKRVVRNLVSAAGAGGVGAVGSDGFAGRNPQGKILTLITSFPPDVLSAPLQNAQSGKLVYSQHNGPAFPAVDISGYSSTHDADGQGPESNPYAVLARRDDVLVADAAGNVVFRVGSQGYGAISVFHVFPNITTGACVGQQDPPGFPGCNFVPTSLATDAQGNVYVGGLGSEVPGIGEVVKLDPTGRHVLHTWTGFTSVDGVAVGSDGSVYVSQLEATEAHPINPMAVGVLTKIAPTGTQTNVDVPFPAGVAVDSTNNVYVAAFAIAPETGLGIPGLDTSGQIWRLRIK